MKIFPGMLLVLLVSPLAVLAEEQEAGAESNAEELLTREPTVDDYAGFTRCIDMKRIRTTRVLDERHLVVEMRQKEYYVIQLPRRCPGLRKNRPVMTEPRGRQLCQFDAVRPMNHNGLGGLEPGTRCAIPGFHSVTKEQVAQLRDSLELERQREKEERRNRRKSKNS